MPPKGVGFPDPLSGTLKEVERLVARADSLMYDEKQAKRLATGSP